jgi:CCR4-NOT transcription complex subunit 7/8
LLLTSGLVLNNEIKWISFHSGYDFGYLIKILTQRPLPVRRKSFFELLQLYFPCTYDMKYLSICFQKLQGGLNKLAETTIRS